ncbi:MAG: hypothetical protein K8R40_01375 [Anaerolineaceae bacterium]|nr:hypothetical protein [Anaerolineaceae bacterium]
MPGWLYFDGAFGTVVGWKNTMNAHTQQCPGCQKMLRSLTAVYCPFCGTVLKGKQKDLDQSRISMLYRQAEECIENEEWTEGIYLLIDALRLEPNNVETQNRIKIARHDYRLARLYEWAEEHYFARNFEAALQNLQEIQEEQPDYQDVQTMIDEIEIEARQVDKKHIRKNRRRRFINKSAIGFYYLLIMAFVIVLLIALFLFFTTVI